MTTPVSFPFWSAETASVKAKSRPQRAHAKKVVLKSSLRESADISGLDLYRLYNTLHLGQPAFEHTKPRGKAFCNYKETRNCVVAQSRYAGNRNLQYALNSRKLMGENSR